MGFPVLTRNPRLQAHPGGSQISGALQAGHHHPFVGSNLYDEPNPPCAWGLCQCKLNQELIDLCSRWVKVPYSAAQGALQFLPWLHSCAQLPWVGGWAQPGFAVLKAQMGHSLLSPCLRRKGCSSEGDSAEGNAQTPSHLVCIMGSSFSSAIDSLWLPLLFLSTIIPSELLELMAVQHHLGHKPGQILNWPFIQAQDSPELQYQVWKALIWQMTKMPQPHVTRQWGQCAWLPCPGPGTLPGRVRVRLAPEPAWLPCRSIPMLGPAPPSSTSFPRLLCQQLGHPLNFYGIYD